MSTLFAIGADALALQDLLEEHLTRSEGELTPDVEAAFDDWLRENQHDLTRKLDSYGALIREWDAKAAARKAEAQRLLELSKQDENKARWAKERLKIFFELTGRTKEETERFKFSLAQNGGKAPLIINEDYLPQELPECFQKITVDYDKEVIRQVLEADGYLEFATLAERGTHLRIR